MTRTRAKAEDEQEPDVANKVFIWRNPLRGEIAVVARNEKEARKTATAQNVHFAALLTGAPLVIDPSQPGAVVHRWRRG